MSATLINVALDLETLGTNENAAIIQIGFCVPLFDRPNLPEGVDHEIEVTISYHACRDMIRQCIFSMTNDTMEWWEKQPTRTSVFSGQDTHTDALDKIEAWIFAVTSKGAKLAVWGNGSDFDNRLLAYTFSAFGYKPQWEFRNNRDLRTLKALFPITMNDADMNAGEIKHTAIGDARFEARLMHETWNNYTQLERVFSAHPVRPMSDADIVWIYEEVSHQVLRPQDKRIVFGVARAIEAHIKGATEPQMTKPKTYSRCSNTLRLLGKPYPRTCQECGLGPCKDPIKGAKE